MSVTREFLQPLKRRLIKPSLLIVTNGKDNEIIDLIYDHASLIPCCFKPGLHIVVMVVSTVANMFLTLFQAVLIHVNTLITTSQA